MSEVTGLIISQHYPLISLNVVSHALHWLLVNLGCSSDLDVTLLCFKCYFGSLPVFDVF